MDLNLLIPFLAALGLFFTALPGMARDLWSKGLESLVITIRSLTTFSVMLAVLSVAMVDGPAVDWDANVGITLVALLITSFAGWLYFFLYLARRRLSRPVTPATQLPRWADSAYWLIVAAPGWFVCAWTTLYLVGFFHPR
jgi:hypothetical protein